MSVTAISSIASADGRVSFRAIEVLRLLNACSTSGPAQDRKEPLSTRGVTVTVVYGGSAFSDIAGGIKVAHLTGSAPGGLNAPYLLNASTLIDDDQRDELEGAAGGSNLYVARVSGPKHDVIGGLKPGEIVLNP